MLVQACLHFTFILPQILNHKDTHSTLLCQVLRHFAIPTPKHLARESLGCKSHKICPSGSRTLLVLPYKKDMAKAIGKLLFAPHLGRKQNRDKVVVAVGRRHFLLHYDGKQKELLASGGRRHHHTKRLLKCSGKACRRTTATTLWEGGW